MPSATTLGTGKPQLALANCDKGYRGYHLNIPVSPYHYLRLLEYTRTQDNIPYSSITSNVMLPIQDAADLLGV